MAMNHHPANSYFANRLMFASFGEVIYHFPRIKTMMEHIVVPAGYFGSDFIDMKNQDLIDEDFRDRIFAVQDTMTDDDYEQAIHDLYKARPYLTSEQTSDTDIRFFTDLMMAVIEGDGPIAYIENELLLAHSNYMTPPEYLGAHRYRMFLENQL